MLKKLFLFAVVAVGASALWNWTRVIAVSEHVRDHWIASQKDQALEDWEVHFRRGLRKLDRRIEGLERRSRDEALAAETARLQLERAERQLTRGAKLVASFEGQLKQADAQGFVFAGQQYDLELARLQLQRFETERKLLSARRASLTASVESHQRTSTQLDQALTQLRQRRMALEERGRLLQLRRQVLETQRSLETIEQERCAMRRRQLAPAETLDSLCRVAEDALDRAEARQRIERRQRPKRTLSLDQAADGQLVPSEY